MIMSRNSLTSRTLYISWLWFVHGALLFFSAAFFVLWIDSRTQSLHVPIYSPANEAIEYNKEVTIFNGSLGHPYIYGGHPSPEIDAAWDRVSTDIKPTRITLEQLEKMGYSDAPSRVKFRDEDGGGYMAALEVAHQVHCVEHYESWDPYFTESTPEYLRHHLDHCIENLRQTLMCAADVGIIPYQWVVGFDHPVPDFRTKHQCRNHEKVIEWGYAHEVHIPREHVTRFGDVVDLLEHP
ncbi:hypothetical protein BS17DRAFT_217046 [Gyrodon lividus]|nr:hypothetical protein BS17DRAFT_217046 [Gyrodon lividus]